MMILRDPEKIAAKLTEPQRECILSLSTEWQEKGYSKVYADLLWVLGGSDLHGVYDSLVDCEYHSRPEKCQNYRHRLLPLGLEVKKHILDDK